MAPAFYTARQIGPNSYRLTKFDVDLNVESVYNLVWSKRGWSCDCPQSNKPTCKHRQDLLPYFIRSKAVNTGKFWDFEKGEWCYPLGKPEDQ